MPLSQKVQNELLDRGYSRRNIAQILLGASAVLPFFHEFAFAQDAQPGSLARGGSDPVGEVIEDEPGHGARLWALPALGGIGHPRDSIESRTSYGAVTA